MNYKFYQILLLFALPIALCAQNSGDQFLYLKGQVQAFNPERPHDYKGLTYEESKKKGVFIWVSQNDGEPGNASVCETRLIWEIDKKLKSFSLKDEDLKEANAYYWQLCRTCDRGFQAVEKGTLNGNQLKNGDWEVVLDVEVIGHLTGKRYQFKMKRTFLVE